MRIWKIPDQVLRLAIVFILLAAGVIAVRNQFIPESFGVEGHYRGQAVVDAAELEIRYAGVQACLDCHEDVGELKQSSYHRGVACETCHGAAAAHVDEPDEFAPVRPSGREPCLSCHLYLPSRPTGFPQVMAELHNPTKACMECHDPHEPTPPVVPSTCGACHAGVARTKAVSHHAPLPCETCHDAPAEHRQDPRGFQAKKPTDRGFCGQCHAEGAILPENIDLGRRRVPRIDLATHGERYVCWQCHYPHFPESR
jgi:ribosomal protein S27AE